jgi:hypothetical protein
MVKSEIKRPLRRRKYRWSITRKLILKRKAVSCGLNSYESAHGQMAGCYI